MRLDEWARHELTCIQTRFGRCRAQRLPMRHNDDTTSAPRVARGQRCGGYMYIASRTCDAPARADGDERLSQTPDDLLIGRSRVRIAHVDAAHLIGEIEAPGRDVVGPAAQKAVPFDQVRRYAVGDHADDGLSTLDPGCLTMEPSVGSEVGGVEAEKSAVVYL
nr:hypothetical protein CFP56_04600 [Quercus suber]